jgi:manganese/zinc/iron transport system ATP- binding protein
MPQPSAPTPLPETALAISDLTVAYGAAPVVDGLSARFPAGSMTAVIGPNGAGKSTLLKAALGLVPAVSGTARAFGHPVAASRHRIAYVPQRAAVDWDFPVRVIDVVRMGLYRRTGLLGRLTPGLKARAMDHLGRLGMADLAARQIGALSGGQQQRVFLARALAQEADLVILDEPFAGVDAATEAVIVSVLHGLRAEGRSVIAVHHDLSTVTAYFDRVLLMNRRLIAEGPVATTFRREAVAAAYGQELLTAIPA